MIEVFIADGAPSVFGEGETYLFTATEGSVDDTDPAVSTYGPGAVNGLSQGTDNTDRFTFISAVAGVVDGTYITATATLGGNTSEFSGVVLAKVLEDCSNGIDDDGDGKIDGDDPECMDCDADGILNFSDLDDDNDGIPDSYERQSTQGIAGTIGLGNDVQGITSYAIDGTTISYVSGYNPGECLAVDAGLQGHALRLTNPNASLRLLRIDFTVDVSNLSFKVTDFDKSELMDLTVYDENFTPYDLSREGIVSMGSRVTQNAAGYRFTGDGGPANIDGMDPAQDNLGSVVFHFPGKVGTVLFNSGHSGDSLYITEMKFNVVDTDSDGVLDPCDLDADNDGIYDLVEAGHTAADADNNGMVDGTALTYGTNGFLNVLETAPDNGIPSYVVSDIDGDGIIDAAELDADNDGCFDVNEAGYTDSNSDGELGPVPLLVDGSGLVTSGEP